MIVTLIKKDRIFNITLPEKIKGRFWITDCDGTGKKRNLISVEAVDDKWVLKGSEAAFVFDVNKGVIDEVTLEEHYFYTIKIADDEDAYIYAEAANSERQIFNKFIVADGTEISIGRERDNQICVDNRYVSAHHAVLNYVDNSWTISDSNSTNGTFVNNMRVGIRNLKPGDTIFIIGFKIIIGGGFIAFNNPDNTVRYDTNFIHELVMQEEGERIEKEIKVQPDFFYRAPRFKRDIETLRFKIDGPPSQETGNNLPLPMVIGPSLTMGMASMTSGAFSVINSMNSGGTIMNAIPTLAMSASMVLGMVMWPILTKKYESKKSREKEAERQKLYKDYLFSMYVNNECCIDFRKKVHLNTEQLGLPKKESEDVFRELLARMKELSQSECSGDYIKGIVRNKYLPEAYQNMLILLCEYIAYRRNMDKEVIHFCKQNITNALYRDMMQEWTKGKKVK